MTVSIAAASAAITSTQPKSIDAIGWPAIVPTWTHAREKRTKPQQAWKSQFHT
jgi:hypothetical protein